MFVVHLDNNNNNAAREETGGRAEMWINYAMLNATHDIDMKRTQTLIASFIPIKAYAMAVITEHNI